MGSIIGELKQAVLFLKKKNQKDFYSSGSVPFHGRGLKYRNFFASFCSQKEVLP
jgi:hypothetical protein